MNNEKYDIWLKISYGFDEVLKQAYLAMIQINNLCGDWVLINGLHRIGCAYRVQIETREDYAEKIRKEIIEPLDLKMEVSRGFSAS